MIWLILGVLLWAFAHSAKRVIPGFHASLKSAEKPMVAGLSVIALLLMIIGYRAADYVPLYSPVPGMGHANNTLMLLSIFMFGVGGTKGLLYPRIRHPMLWGVVLWALAHLLVNGDLASVILFGGMGIWALAEMVLVGRAVPWQRPGPGRGIKGDAMNLVGTLILLGLIAGIHIWLGYNPFLGDYA